MVNNYKNPPKPQKLQKNPNIFRLQTFDQWLGVTDTMIDPMTVSMIDPRLNPWPAQHRPHEQTHDRTHE